MESPTIKLVRINSSENFFFCQFALVHFLLLLESVTFPTSEIRLSFKRGNNNAPW